MLGPSPDWIVGVSGLELCLRNCSWAEEREVFLYPWDAGVDSGVSYESPDQPTFPPQPITRLALLLNFKYTLKRGFLRREKSEVGKQQSTLTKTR